MICDPQGARAGYREFIPETGNDIWLHSPGREPVYGVQVIVYPGGKFEGSDKDKDYTFTHATFQLPTSEGFHGISILKNDVVCERPSVVPEAVLADNPAHVA